MSTIATPSGSMSPPIHRLSGAHALAPIPTPRVARRFAPIAAMLALLLVTLLVGQAALRDESRPPGPVAAPAIAESTALAGLQTVACNIAPRTGELPTGAPTSASVFSDPVGGVPQAPPPSDQLPELGDPVDRAAIDGIAATLAELHACQESGDADRALALSSTDLLRRTGGQALIWRVSAPDAYRIDNIMRLADGRAMATLVEPSAPLTFVVLTPEGERWLIDEVSIAESSAIPAATTPPPPACAAPALPVDVAPPAAGIERPAGLIPFDADQQILAGPFPSEVFSRPPYTGEAVDAPAAAAIRVMLAALRDCALVDVAAQTAPDVRTATAPRVLAFFSPDFFARGRIDVLPDPWWIGYPIWFGWSDWDLSAAEIRQLEDGRVLALLDSTTAADRAALILVQRDGSWLIDEMAYVSDDPTTWQPPADCTLPVRTELRPAPDWAQPLAYESVLPDPIEDNAWLDGSPLAAEQKGLQPANMAPDATLPVGVPVDAETRAGVAAAITDLIACRGVVDDPQRMGRNTLGYFRSFELMSDDLFRRYQPAQPLDPRWWDSFEGVSGIAPKALDPAWLDGLQALPDGRVLALLTTNRLGGQYQAMVFVQVDGRWLLDEFAWIGDITIPPTPIPTPEPADNAPATSVEIALSELIFTPNQVEIPAEQEATLTLINTGVAQHSFVIAELGVAQALAPGESINLRITAPAGTYRFVCDVPGHAEAGMTGVLTVVDSPATPTS